VPHQFSNFTKAPARHATRAFDRNGERGGHRQTFCSKLFARLYPRKRSHGVQGETITKVAVLDDWQGVARGRADWSPLLAAPAELALGLLLAAARAIPSGDANIRAGRFQEGLPAGISLAGKSIGIIGLGRLGSYMASYCRALNMTVVAWSDNLTVEQARAAGAILVSKQALLSGSDAVSIHLVFSSRSRGLITKYAMYIFDYAEPNGLRVAMLRPERVTAIVSQMATRMKRASATPGKGSNANPWSIGRPWALV